jgi:hypothetical protein
LRKVLCAQLPYSFAGQADRGWVEQLGRLQGRDDGLQNLASPVDLACAGKCMCGERRDN